MTSLGVPKVIDRGVLKLERVQVICPACGQQVEAVATDGPVKGYCAVAKQYVDFLMPQARQSTAHTDRHLTAETKAKISAAATGVVGALILTVFYRTLNWQLVKTVFIDTVEITAMLLMIIAGAMGFSQIVAFTGASRGLIEFSLGLPLPPVLIVAAMLAVSLFLGMFISLVAIMMLLLPLFVPVVIAFGFDPVWFAVMFLLSLEMGATSPPVGLTLFVLKSAAPPDTTMGDIYKAGLPFLGADLIALVLILAFPVIALWLPYLMH